MPDTRSPEYRQGCGRTTVMVVAKMSQGREPFRPTEARNGVGAPWGDQVEILIHVMVSEATYPALAHLVCLDSPLHFLGPLFFIPEQGTSEHLSHRIAGISSKHGNHLEFGVVMQSLWLLMSSPGLRSLYFLTLRGSDTGMENIP